MSTVRLKSPAKINLTLDVLGKDEVNDKHFINTIFYRDDSFFDEIELVEIKGKENVLHCNTPGVPKSRLNTVLQALKALNISGYEVTIKKNIPIQAGLGGASSNAAVVLKYFGQEKNIPEFQLHSIAREIGADVPFFLLDDNLAYFEGFGDQLLQSWQIKALQIEYIETGIKVSSGQAYFELDLDQCGQNSVKTEALLKVINQDAEISAEILEPYIHNDFETSFFKKNPDFKGKGYLCGSGGMMWGFSD